MLHALSIWLLLLCGAAALVAGTVIFWASALFVMEMTALAMLALWRAITGKTPAEDHPLPPLSASANLNHPPPGKRKTSL
jgi:hypothetical protein